MAVWGGFTNNCEKKRSEKQREKERYIHLNSEFQRIARRDKKAFSKKRYESFPQRSMQRNTGNRQIVEH